MENNQVILKGFDVEVVLDALKMELYKEQYDWGPTTLYDNNGNVIRRDFYCNRKLTKRGKQIQSVINYINRQLKNNESQ